MLSHSKLLSFIELAKGIINKLPRYNSKFSNRIYDNHQQIVIIVFKQKLKLTYRGVIEFLESNKEARRIIGLKRIPDHSTLIKFLKRISASLLGSLLAIKEAEIIAIDSTGFETESMSYYYRTIHNEVKPRRHYAKLSIAIDAEKQLVLSQKVRRGPRNDNVDFKSVLKNLSAKFVVADKGYDSRENRYFVLRKLKAYPHIPRRIISGATYERAGVKLKFDENIYHQRSKVESVFSAIKRKYGSIIRSRSFSQQKKEIICRLIAYNLDRQIILSSLLIIGFQQSSRKIILYTLFSYVFYGKTRKNSRSCNKLL